MNDEDALRTNISFIEIKYNVGGKEIMCFHCKLNGSTLTPKYASCKFMAFSYESKLGVKKLCIKNCSHG